MLLHRQLYRLGHNIRMSDSRLPYNVLYSQLEQGHMLLADRRNAFMATSIRSLKSATFNLTDRRLLHPTGLHVSIKCHVLKLNTTTLQLSEAITETSMPQSPAHIKISLTSHHFVADNVTHILASTPTTTKLTFNDDEEDIIHNGWSPEKKYIQGMLPVYKK